MSREHPGDSEGVMRARIDAGHIVCWAPEDESKNEMKPNLTSHRASDVGRHVSAKVEWGVERDWLEEELIGVLSSMIRKTREMRPVNR